MDDTRRLESLRADVRRIDSELQDLERRYSSSSNRRSHGEQYDRKLAEFKKAVNALDNYLDSVR
ncbi:MAG: hypothetical protein LBR23_04480 [Spirochaetaceae bacterium]|nr:hypothetical protein [Spirochaetaceae bacterium]